MSAKKSKSLLDRTWSCSQCAIACAVTGFAVIVPTLLIADATESSTEKAYRKEITALKAEVIPQDIMKCGTLPNSLKMTTWDAAKRSAYWLNDANFYPQYSRAKDLLFGDIPIPDAAARDPHVFAVWLSLTTPILNGPTTWWNATYDGYTQYMCSSPHFQTYFARLQEFADIFKDCGYDALSQDKDTTIVQQLNLDIDTMYIPGAPLCGASSTDTGGDPGSQTSDGCNCQTLGGSNANDPTGSCGMKLWANNTQCNAILQAKWTSAAQPSANVAFQDKTRDMWLAAKAMALEGHMTVTQIHTLMVHTAWFVWSTARRLSYMANTNTAACDLTGTDCDVSEPARFSPIMGYNGNSIPYSLWRSGTTTGPFTIPAFTGGTGGASTDCFTQWGSFDNRITASTCNNVGVDQGWASAVAYIFNSDVTDQGWLHAMQWSEMHTPATWNKGGGSVAQVKGSFFEWAMQWNDNSNKQLSAATGTSNSFNTDAEGMLKGETVWSLGLGWTNAVQYRSCLSSSSVIDNCPAGCLEYMGLNGCFWPFTQTSKLPRGDNEQPVYATELPAWCGGSPCNPPQTGNLGSITSFPHKNFRYVPFTDENQPLSWFVDDTANHIGISN